jgi:lysophospholipase L1-like esterase
MPSPPPPARGDSLDALNEVVPRDGLPHFFRKLDAGGSVRIAYFGGSITEQQGWRVQSHAWLQKQYPEAKIGEINAAIAGTGSNLGVFRLQGDVLDKNPDLIFVEFAVNDGGHRPDQIHRTMRTMEGIVRKTWRALPDCDIVFVYTLTAEDIKGLKQGKMRPSAAAMEVVAEHYGIPSIDFGVGIARLEAQGRLVMAASGVPVDRPSGEMPDVTAEVQAGADGRIVFSRDGVHPFPDTGHVLYTQALIRSMSVLRGKATIAGKARVTGKPLADDNWENARMIHLGRNPSVIGIHVGGSGKAALLNPTDNPRARSFANRTPTLWKLEPGATLRFRFRGTAAAFYDLVGPDGGAVRVSLDNTESTQQRFDSYCSWWRLSRLNVGENLRDGEHVVEVTVLPDEINKREILFESNRPNFDKFPEQYQGTNWHVGSVLVLGDIIPDVR